MSWYNFFAIPRKLTEEVDLASPLASYIDSVYNTNDGHKFEIISAAKELSKLRSRAVVQPLDHQQSGIDVVTRYYDQLVAIENKIVISPTQNPIIFKWKDAFCKRRFICKKPATHYISSLALERAFVLFNCGCLYSQIGADQPMNTEEEIRTAAIMFQKAAGVFSHLRSLVLSSIQKDCDPDLSPGTLRSLVPLLIAQAQECYYINASKVSQNQGELAEIAACVSYMYWEALEVMTNETVRGIWKRKWISTVKGKSIAYQALMNYHQGALDREETRIGSQISRLKKASVLMMEVSTRYDSSEYLEAAMRNVYNALESARKANQLIFDEEIPDFETLPAVSPTVLANAWSLPKPLSSLFTDMFANLVTVQVLKTLPAYQKHKKDFVKRELNNLTNQTQLLDETLKSLNLPAALDDVIKSEALLRTIKQKSHMMKQLGRHSELLRLIKEFYPLFKFNEQILDEANKVLTKEQETDESLCKQFGMKWSGMKTDQLSNSLTQEIKEHRNIINSFFITEKMVRNMFPDNSADMKLLGNQNELNSCIPDHQSEFSRGTSETIQKLKGLMNHVQGIRTARQTIVEELKSNGHGIANDFLKALSETQLLNEESISEKQVDQMLSPLKEKINASIKDQENVLEEIQKWNRVFIGEIPRYPDDAEMEQFLQQMNEGYDVFQELKSTLEDNAKICKELTPVLVRLEQRVCEYVTTRQTEKLNLMSKLQQSILPGNTPFAIPPKPSHAVPQGPMALPRTFTLPEPPPPYENLMDFTTVFTPDLPGNEANPIQWTPPNPPPRGNSVNELISKWYQQLERIQEE
ncbi:unnamed protein product [Auanema sp. JU1783]|nr:unnamed protein product [Auanema sp. JU1783]